MRSPRIWPASRLALQEFRPWWISTSNAGGGTPASRWNLGLESAEELSSSWFQGMAIFSQISRTIPPDSSMFCWIHVCPHPTVIQSFASFPSCWQYSIFHLYGEGPSFCRFWKEVVLRCTELCGLVWKWGTYAPKRSFSSRKWWPIIKDLHSPFFSRRPLYWQCFPKALLCRQCCCLRVDVYEVEVCHKMPTRWTNSFWFACLAPPFQRRVFLSIYPIDYC